MAARLSPDARGSAVDARSLGVPGGAGDSPAGGRRASLAGRRIACPTSGPPIDRDPRLMCEAVDVLIVGAGFSGLCMAIKLREAGMDSFLIIEKGEEIGGTWWYNRYPGCACDIPSHLYSFSFDRNPEWTRMFAEQPEILAY